ncbi:MAG: hypothetical protein B7Z66_11050 [Chromatiales bacterium 21-64-14]|nr:MAG: hypothetical protein B7Z66_11050 [Chromatiales bacterium 21-64-14]
MAPRAVAVLLGKTHTPALPPLDPGTSVPDFPKQIANLPVDATSPLANAVFLQLVAMMTPTDMRYERRRLFERSLLALHRVSRASPYYDVLTARALFNLYRRPAALRYLSSPKTPAERALLQYLDGNYPELARLVPTIHAPVLRAMALIELKAVGYYYQNPDGGQDVDVPIPSQGWATLLVSAERDADAWYAPENMPFFVSLQGLFPAFDTPFRKAVEGRIASGTLKTDGRDYALFDVIFRHAFSSQGPACCARYGSRLEPADIWALYRDLAIGNLLRKLDRDVWTYASYGSGKALAEQVAPWLQGNPEFMVLYAEALQGYAAKTSGNARMFLLKKALQLASNAIRLGGGSNWLVASAGTVRSQILGVLSPGSPQVNTGNDCWLARCDFPSSIEVDAYDGDPLALPYENTQFSLLIVAAKSGALDAAGIQHELQTRFDGAPGKVPFIAGRLIAAGHNGKAITLLQDAITRGDASSNVYLDLGDLLIGKGQYREASKTFMQYPDLRNPPGKDPVATADFAYGSGRKLYWLGHYEEAIPLYEIAARLDTGAEVEYTAQKYLAFVHSDYSAAIVAAYRQAKRYNSPDGYRDYLTILQLAGLHEAAETGFQEIAPRFNSPSLWASLFVGQRMEKKSFDQMRKWVGDYLINANDVGQQRQAIYYLMHQSVMDRGPSMAKVAAIARMEESIPLSAIQFQEKAMIGRLHEHFPGRTAPCVAGNVHCTPRTAESARYARDRVAGFLYAYTLLEQGNYGASLDAFLQYDRAQPLYGSDRVAMSLAYVAIAASEAREPEILAGLSTMLDGKDGRQIGKFDGNLTRAVIDADRGRRATSLQELIAAQRNVSRDAWRPSDTWFELLQVADWVYTKTGDKRVLREAVHWAHEHEMIQPQDSWAYAFEARYATDRAARVRAAAFAGYLDPESVWLAEVPPAIRRRAHAWWPKHDPFRLRGKSGKKPAMSL